MQYFDIFSEIDFAVFWFFGTIVVFGAFFLWCVLIFLSFVVIQVSNCSFTVLWKQKRTINIYKTKTSTKPNTSLSLIFRINSFSILTFYVIKIFWVGRKHRNREIIGEQNQPTVLFLLVVWWLLKLLLRIYCLWYVVLYLILGCLIFVVIFMSHVAMFPDMKNLYALKLNTNKKPVFLWLVDFLPVLILIF